MGTKKGAEREPYPHEEDHRQCRLRRHQQASQDLPPSASNSPAGDGHRNVGLRLHQGRKDTEHETGEPGGEHRKRQHGRINRDLLKVLGEAVPQRAGQQPQERSQLQRRQAQPGHAAEDREQRGFRQELADEPSATRPESSPDCHSPAPGSDLPEHEIGDVDARDQKHESGCEPDHVEGSRIVGGKRFAEPLDKHSATPVGVRVTLAIVCGNDIPGCGSLPDGDPGLQATHHVQPRHLPSE